MDVWIGFTLNFNGDDTLEIALWSLVSGGSFLGNMEFTVRQLLKYGSNRHTASKLFLEYKGGGPQDQRHHSSLK